MKNKLQNILKSIGMIFLLLFFSSIFFAILNIDLTNISETNYILLVTISNLLLIVIYILIYKKTLIKDFKEYKKNISTNIETSIKYWSIGFSIMIVSNLIITFLLNKSISGNEQDIRAYLDSFPILMIFNTVIYAPITEELTFRKSIKDAINNKWFYVIISGLLFGILHIISYITNWTDLIYLIPYSSLGVAFALLYHKTDNIFSCISMHALHNLLAIIVYLFGASV